MLEGANDGIGTETSLLLSEKSILFVECVQATDKSNTDCKYIFKCKLEVFYQIF